MQKRTNKRRHDTEQANHERDINIQTEHAAGMREVVEGAGKAAAYRLRWSHNNNVRLKR